MSLSEDEMKRIKEEEIYRQEIRAELEKAKPSRITKEKIWAFLNSSFTLLFCSTVVIGFLGWAFSTYQTLNKEQSDKIEMQQKLNIEIDSRVKETLVALDLVKINVEKNFEKSGGCYSPLFINKTTIDLLNGDISDVPAAVPSVVYSEFEKKGLQGLVNEWKRIVDENDRKDFVQAITEHQQLRERALTLADYDCDNLSKSTEKQKKPSLEEIKKEKEASKEAIDDAKNRVNSMKKYFAPKSIRRGFWWFIGF